MVRLTRDGKEPPQSEGREWHFELSQSKPVCGRKQRLTPSLNPEPWFSNFSVLWGHLGGVVKNVHPRALLKDLLSLMKFWSRT